LQWTPSQRAHTALISCYSRVEQRSQNMTISILSIGFRFGNHLPHFETLELQLQQTRHNNIPYFSCAPRVTISQSSRLCSISVIQLQRSHLKNFDAIFKEYIMLKNSKFNNTTLLQRLIENTQAHLDGLGLVSCRHATERNLSDGALDVFERLLVTTTS
jgi:hypothetical protein